MFTQGEGISRHKNTTTDSYYILHDKVQSQKVLEISYVNSTELKTQPEINEIKFPSGTIAI